MLIKNPDKTRIISNIRSILGRLEKRMLLIFCLVLCFLLGVIAHKEGVFEKIKETTLYKIVRRPQNVLKGLTARPERISIDIGYRDFQKLAYKRQVALANRILITSPDDYVPVEIRHKDKIVRAKIRLKGDLVDQLEGIKWPFRIVIRGENTLLGMKVFSIHTPSARDYLYEWLLHKAMKREDVIALRYDFIDVTINGKHLGIYALEEHFEKRLIEDNQRREGVIICFSEDSDIRNIGHFGWPTYKRIDFYSADIDLYRPTKTLGDPVLRKQFMLAKDSLESFRRGELELSDVFDCKVLARYLALLDLFNARHAAKYGNLKFYYNPVTSKLEPICFDAEYVGNENFADEGIYAENWYEDYLNLGGVFFKDKGLYRLYMQELARISEASYLDNLFNGIDEELKTKLNIVYSEYPVFHFEKERFYRKQLYIKKILDLPTVIDAYFVKYSQDAGKKVIELNIANTRPIPVRIVSVDLSDEVKFPVEARERIIQSSVPKKPLNIERVEFVLPQDFEWKEEYVNKLNVNYALVGLKKLRTEKVIPWIDLDEDLIGNDPLRQAPNIQEFGFLSLDAETKKIFVKPGNQNIDKNLIIPRGYKLVCAEGTRLDMSNSSKIISYSAIEFIGSEEKPIFINSEGSTGGGIVVIDAEEKSILKHVIFDSLSKPSEGYWELTGAVTFYQSPVRIYQCQFSNNNSEDSLNIIRSDFLIERTLFKNSSFDALDVDFGRGKITDSSFVDCGNDAIDFSGSLVELERVLVKTAGDKGLSVGEKSKVSANKLEVEDAEFGVACKDASEVNIDNIAISNCSIGLALYQKKSEFGPAFMNIRELIMTKVHEPYLVQAPSGLNVKGKTIKSDQEHVKGILDKYLK